MRAALTAAMAVALTLASSPCLAQGPTPDMQEADSLFNDGRALMDAGQIAAACGKLERSFQLAPRLGTMLNLGGCYERNGQLARALGVYEHAATMAHEAGRTDRESAARGLAAAVEPRVARLLLVLVEPPAGLVVDVDGEGVSATGGGLVPVDPGDRVIHARAPGKRAWSAPLHLVAGDIARVRLPPLADADPVPPAPAVRAPAGQGQGLRTGAVAAGTGVAVAGIALGIVEGLRAKSQHDASSPHCDASGCDADGETLIHGAMTAGNVSTGAFIGAGVGLVVAGLAWLVSPSRPAAVAAPGGFSAIARF